MKSWSGVRVAVCLVLVLVSAQHVAAQSTSPAVQFGFDVASTTRARALGMTVVSLITDFAFSSYPEPSYEHDQDTVIREIFSRMDEFREAGVQGMIWRMLSDDPTFDTRNYHGEAERHWGLLRADGAPKRAFLPFLNGIRDERDGRGVAARATN